MPERRFRVGLLLGESGKIDTAFLLRARIESGAVLIDELVRLNLLQAIAVSPDGLPTLMPYPFLTCSCSGFRLCDHCRAWESKCCALLAAARAVDPESRVTQSRDITRG